MSPGGIADALSARTNPPWTDCGDPTHPEFGLVFAWPVARGAVALTFDRMGRRHATTVFDRRRLGATLVVHGRLFEVVYGHWDRTSR
jgi:hypothetical protein